jgi:hypothetical protein
MTLTILDLIDNIMRKITQLAVKKFLNHENFVMGNTNVWTSPNITKKNGTEYTTTIISKMILHNNEIATKVGKGDSILIDTCGWFSVTTKERLNGLLDTLGLPKIQQKNFKWYLMGKEWNGKEVRINTKTHEWEYNS